VTDNFNAESAVIGGLLLFPEECSYAVDILTQADFENPLAAEAFSIISKAAFSGKKMDAAIFGSAEVPEETKKYALASAEAFISTANYDGYVDTVKTESGRRRVTKKLNELVVEHESYDELLSSIGRIASEESTRGKGEDDGYLMDYLSSFDKPVDPKSRILTGFSKLDKAFHGLRKGSLCYIGAYPSTGKTSFAANIALKNYTDQKRVQFFSLEMSKEQILDRIFASWKQIDYGAIDLRRVSERELLDVANGVNELMVSKRLSLHDSVYSIEAIAGKISKFKPDLAIVDFLQNVRTTSRFPNKKEQIDYISSELKRLARVNNCCIICLSQLVKPDTSTKSAGKSRKPTMSDLKESGNLSADGDYIMLLYRPWVLDKVNFSPEEAHVLLDKNKFYGSCGIIDMNFEGKYQKFTEVETRYED
jgi:replicative DNA helicase